MGVLRKEGMKEMRRERSKHKIRVFLYMWFSLLYMEWILKEVCRLSFSGKSIIFTGLIALAAGLFVEAVCAIFKMKSTKVLFGIFLGAGWVLFSTQAVYQRFFGKFLVLYSVTEGGVAQVTGEGMLDSAFAAVKASLPQILLLSLPFVCYLIFAKRRIDLGKQKRYAPLLWGSGGALVLAMFYFFLCLIPDSRGIYYDTFDADLNIAEYGLLDTLGKDIRYNLLGVKQDVVLETVGDETVGETLPNIVIQVEDHNYIRKPNVMEIDFKELAEKEKNENMKSLHSYFSAEEPTYTNAYTGMFEGYNLIMVTAEGFSPYAVDEELTPTLYKMMTEGFQFPNFYTPIWGVSTSDGEYVACTGLIPKSGVWSFAESSDNYMPFCMGNQFKKIGVDLRFAYHNHSYTYYHRDQSHPNMGYVYKGLRGGLTEQQIKPVWPESDLEMIEATTSEYIQSEKQFVTYYMTVSGHLQYSKTGNSMSNKNWDLVKHLDCSDTLKAYYACNIELDRAMEQLLKQLNEAGIADKTVIAISPDHYPYGLEDKESGDTYHYFNEILGHKVETNFELYKGIFILYNQGMKEPVVIDKYASSLDIIPTLSNLFGLEYDSRLLMGKDILSSTSPLILFSNRSWITERGKYNARTKEFQAFEHQEFASRKEEQEYIQKINKKVSNRFKVSAMILDYDYYGYILAK